MIYKKKLTFEDGEGYGVVFNYSKRVHLMC